MLSAEDIIGALQDCFAKDVEIRFRHFVRSTPATHWLIATDFVLTGEERRNDAFAFSVIPFDSGWDAIVGDIRAAGTKDIKKVRSIAPSMLSYLRADRRFHFCFLPNRDRHNLVTLPMVQDAIDRSISQMRQWQNQSDRVDTIKAFQGLQQDAKARRFNVPLFNDMVLTATLASWLSVLLAKHARADLVLWLPDRDKMTSAYGGIIHQMFNVSFSGLCERLGINERLTQLAIAHEPVPDAKRAWYDDFVRIPDHIAGAMARWDFVANKITSDPPKHVEMVEKVIADHPALAIIPINFNVFGVAASQVVASSVTAQTSGGHLPIPFWAVLDFAVAEQTEPLRRAVHRKLGKQLLSWTSWASVEYIMRPGYARRYGDET